VNYELPLPPLLKPYFVVDLIYDILTTGIILAEWAGEVLFESIWSSPMLHTWRKCKIINCDKRCPVYLT
jgi:hypothetical protein